MRGCLAGVGQLTQYGVGVSERRLAYAPDAGRRFTRANNAARTAVAGIKGDVGANSVAQRATRWAKNITAFPPAAKRGQSGAHVPACSAVEWIRIHRDARPVAVGKARCAGVNARSGNARDDHARNRRGTHITASPAVQNVMGQIGAIMAATGLPHGPAVVAAGPAVRVGFQIAAHPVASRDRTTDVTAARSRHAAGVALALLAGGETFRLLRLVVTFAEGFAGVLGVSPGGWQSQRAQHRAGENSPQPPQRFAARNILGQRFGEFIEQVFHD
jgi:hypothetical protein